MHQTSFPWSFLTKRHQVEVAQNHCNPIYYSAISKQRAIKNFNNIIVQANAKEIPAISIFSNHYFHLKGSLESKQAFSKHKNKHFWEFLMITG